MGVAAVVAVVFLLFVFVMIVVVVVVCFGSRHRDLCVAIVVVVDIIVVTRIVVVGWLHGFGRGFVGVYSVGGVVLCCHLGLVFVIVSMVFVIVIVVAVIVMVIKVTAWLQWYAAGFARTWLSSLLLCSM